MAKAKELIEGVTPEENKVSVEMTLEQKDAFAKFQADEQAKAEKAAVKKEQVEVRLRYEHIVNGIKYGPGKVVVDEALGYAMLQRDHLALEHRLSANESKDTVLEILGAGRAVVRQMSKVTV